MDTQPLIRLDSVFKRYFIREPRFRHRAARAAVASWIYERRKEIWALRDISLELGPGRMLGLIGLNGSGKSTLLKLIAGVSDPTSGRVQTRGALVGLLELGAGFHPDLTGYENIYLQGNLMGLRKSEIDKAVGAIVEFSGLEGFMEWPVKRYSSGMYARLGFSLALHAGAQIILIDEILAVGDAEFQRRGLARIREIKARGETILVLATHDTVVAQEYCDEMIWLDQGRIRHRGSPREVCEAYLRNAMPTLLRILNWGTDQDVYERAQAALAPDSPLRIRDMAFRDESGRPVNEMPPGRPAALVVRLEAQRALDGLDLTVFLTQADQRVAVEIQSAETNQPLNAPAGLSELVVRLEPQILLDGDYAASVLIAETGERKRYLATAFRQAKLLIRDPSGRPAKYLIAHPHRWTAYPGRKEC